MVFSFSLSWGYHEGWEPLFNHGLAPLLAIYFYGSAAAQGAGDGMRNLEIEGETVLSEGSAMGRSEYYSHLRTVFILNQNVVTKPASLHPFPVVFVLNALFLELTSCLWGWNLLEPVRVWNSDPFTSHEKTGLSAYLLTLPPLAQVGKYSFEVRYRKFSTVLFAETWLLKGRDSRDVFGDISLVSLKPPPSFLHFFLVVWQCTEIVPHRNENWRTCHFKRFQFGGKILKKNEALVGVLRVETFPGHERRPGSLG